MKCKFDPSKFRQVKLLTVDNLYNTKILQLPKALCKLNWLDYFTLGGNKQALEQAATADMNIIKTN